MIGYLELIIIFFFLIQTIVVIIALIDILKSDFQGINKIIWVVVVIFLPIIGAILYFVMGKRQKIAA